MVLAAVRRSYLGLVVAGLGMAVGGDWLFWERPIGVSLAVFAGFLLLALAWRFGVQMRSAAAWVSLAAFVGMILALGKEPRFLSVTGALVALGMLVISMRSGPMAAMRAYLLRGMLLLGELFFRVGADCVVAGRWFWRHPRLGPRWVKVVVLWVLPLAAGGVFLLLFVAGNPILGEWARVASETLWAWVKMLPEWLSVGRVFMWLVIGYCTWSVLRATQWRPKVLRAPPVMTVRGPEGRGIFDGWAWVVRCLVVFNVVFAVETIVDMVYLWGGLSLPAGMTRAAFAHRAAYPLVAATLLAATFVLVVFRRPSPRAARVLVYAWLGQNALLVLATILRLKLYVDVFSLSRWRIATIVWCGLVGAGLVWIVVKIARHKSNAWLVRWNVITLAAVLYGCAFVNWEGMISGFNVGHCKEVDGNGVVLDVAYLRGLGSSALPALVSVQEKLPVERRWEVQEAVKELRGEVMHDLGNWRGWTWDRGGAGAVMANWKETKYEAASRTPVTTDEEPDLWRGVRTPERSY